MTKRNIAIAGVVGVGLMAAAYITNGSGSNGAPSSSGQPVVETLSNNDTTVSDSLPKVEGINSGGDQAEWDGKTTDADNKRKKDMSGWESPRSYGWWGNHGSGPKPVFESTQATTSLLQTLHEMNEVNTMAFGQQYANYVGQDWPWFQYWGEYHHSDVYSDTGDYPLVFGYDIQDFFKGHKFQEYIKWAAKQGGIITFSWLAANPLGGDAYNVTCGNYDDLMAELLPGGDLHDTWKSWLDTVSEFMDDLTFDNGEAIPVIFRLFHEGTASWYWWGTTCSSSDSYVDAWKFTATYLNEKGHKNILWEYAPSKPSTLTDEFTDYYPGDDFIDIISFDRYATNATYSDYVTADCEVVVEYAQEHNKVAALAETGIWKGIQNITNSLWYENKFLEPIMEKCPQLAYALTYTNFEEQTYWVPMKDETTYPGFIEFYHDEHTMFLNDSLYHETSYYNYIKGFGAK